MAMKNCKECGTEISSSAKVCPKCGKEQRNFFQKHVILTIILVVIVLGIVFGGSGDKSTSNTVTTSTSTVQGEQQEEKKTEELLEVDYKVLWQDYQDNAIGADAKYKDKMLKLTGEVEDINREIAGNPYVTFKVGTLQNVRLTFKKSEEEKISQLSKGQIITVKGKCSGLLITSTVSLNDCEIIE